MDLHDTLYRAWAIWCVAVVAAPLLCCSGCFLWHRLPLELHKPLVACCAVLFALALVDLLSPISFRGFTVDCILLAAGYVTVSILVGIGIAIAPRILAWIIGIGFCGIAALFAFPTLTELPFLMAVGELIPRQETALTPRAHLRITLYGGATVSHDGASYVLLTHPLPGIEWQHSKRYVEDTECKLDDQHTSTTPSSLVISCGEKPIESMKLP